MEPTVRDTLRQLIVQHGRVLCNDPPRCDDLLRGLCSQYEREVSVLISVLQRRIPATLLANGAGLPPPQLVDRLRQRLEDELAMKAEAAHWVVETWALALVVITAPVSMTVSTTATPVAQPTVIIAVPKMVRIPAGRFLMGSPAGFLLLGREPKRDEDEGPQHWFSGAGAPPRHRVLAAPPLVPAGAKQRFTSARPARNTTLDEDSP